MLARTLLAFLMAALSGAAVEPVRTSLDPPVFLPDGKEFKTWEVAPKFSRTLIVDQANPKASDANPGTPALPLRTINRAAQLAQPGERVVVAAGVYREWVRPARGGAGPDRMISYEAAPGAKVVIKGSRELKVKWQHSEHENYMVSLNLWSARLPPALFEDYNPFREENLSASRLESLGMTWARQLKGTLPYSLPPGFILQNGRRLQQMVSYQDLRWFEGSFWVENGDTIHIHPYGRRDPNDDTFEITTQKQIFAPTQTDLAYIRVQGFLMEDAGNPFPLPQEGALSTTHGHHWIIEDNVIRHINSIGIDIGIQGGAMTRAGLGQIVRRNEIEDCGISGIEGLVVEDALIERNVIRDTGWQDVERMFESAGIKIHFGHNCVYRDNLIENTVGAAAIWLDSMNVNSRVTGNVIVGAQSRFGGLFMEASQAPNMLDHNIVWGTQGHGIYQHDCDELIVVHNLVGESTGNAVYMIISGPRPVGGRLSTAKRNKVQNNIFIGNHGLVHFSDPDNVEKNNLVAEPGSITLARARMELSWEFKAPLPSAPKWKLCERDFRNQLRSGELVPPGPFSRMPLKRSPMRIWPAAARH